MEVILLKDIDRLGEKHSVVRVKDGYGRNFLIPKKLAVIANSYNVQKLEKIKAEEEAQEAARLEEYKAIAEKLEGQTLRIGVKAGTSGKIFGSVNSVQIANGLKEQFDVDIERGKISLPDEIKEIGTYKAVINLHREVECVVDFELVQE